MKITGIAYQQKDKNRVNVSVDGKYRFSLYVSQVASLGVSVGKEYTDKQITDLENESQFGKLYARTLEYSLIRPHSQKEIRDYLYKKTRDKKSSTGSVVKGVSKELTERVFNRLIEKGYISDEEFTRFWVENRNQRKGTSMRKLSSELRSKGVDPEIIDKFISQSDRNDKEELLKIIAKKSRRYSDEKKLIAYLARQGFSYDDIKQALSS